MSNEHLYCDVCNKVIPHGTTHLSVSAMREYFVPDDHASEVVGFAHDVFSCHEDCVPPSVEVDLSRLANRH